MISNIAYNVEEFWYNFDYATNTAYYGFGEAQVGHIRFPYLNAHVMHSELAVEVLRTLEKGLTRYLKKVHGQA